MAAGIGILGFDGAGKRQHRLLGQLIDFLILLRQGADKIAGIQERVKHQNAADAVDEQVKVLHRQFCLNEHSRHGEHCQRKYCRGDAPRHVFAVLKKHRRADAVKIDGKNVKGDIQRSQMQCKIRTEIEHIVLDGIDENLNHCSRHHRIQQNMQQSGVLVMDKNGQVSNDIIRQEQLENDSR